MAKKLSKMIIEHDLSQSTGDLTRTYTPEISQNLPMEGFELPKSVDLLSTIELQDEIAPRYLQACLKMANRAMTGQVNVFKEGDLPHKMALLLAHKLLPSRKVNEAPIEEAPEVNKQTARALKSIIKSITDGDEHVEVNPLPRPRPSGIEVRAEATKKTRHSDG